MRTMTARTLVAAAAALLAAAPAARAQSAFSTRAPAASIRFDTSKVERARELLARAEQRWIDYDIDGSRRDYARATAIMMDQNVYAGPALVALAQTTYAAGAPEQAALVLIDAAQEAARFGDQELQINALLDASLVYFELRNVTEGNALRADVGRLLASTKLPASVKSELEYRVAMKE